MMISGIVHLTSKTIYGFTSRKTPIYLFQPFDELIPPFFVGCSWEDRSKNIIALCKLTTLPCEKNRKGFIEQILGVCGDTKSELDALLWRYCPIRWRKSNTPLTFKTPSFEGIPVLDVPTINIDPLGCRDIDDCISIWKEDGKTNVAITIADVHEWISENPMLIETASQIGQTFYYNGKVQVPMLPPALSEDLCSLVPNQKRLGVTLQFEWTGTMIKDLHLKHTVIINKKSYTYENVKQADDFPVDILKEIASWLGGHEIDDPHEWVEQLMLFYNRESAGILQAYGKGIWRGHTAPDYEKLTKFQSFGAGLDFLAQKGAIYTNYACKHWGIGDKPYCHATSPIRRWADVVNQAILKKRKPIEVDIEQLNKACLYEKRYERDTFFIDVILSGKSNKLLDCVSIDTTEKRTRFWVPLWKRIISVYNVQTPEGKKVNIEYFLDMNKLTWKKRLVFRVEDTNYLELLLPGQSVVEYYEEDLEFLYQPSPLPK